MLVRETLLESSELRGKYPDIPLPAAMLEELGDEAFFVTLPIGRVGARSRNERTYTRAAVEAIVDAVNKHKPGGRWGHLRDEDRPYTYEPPAMKWLAAILDDDGVAWAKGIPTTPEAREHFRLAKIAGGRVGTSVYGFGRMEGENVVDFELETIDLADPARVGIPDTAAEPLITKETEDNTTMTAITMADVPESVRQQIIEQATNQNNGERISEMETRMSELQAQVTTLTEERDAARGEASTLLARYAQARIAESVELAPVQRLVARMVGVRETEDGAVINNDDVRTMADVDAAIENALNEEDIQAFNKDVLAKEMGPKSKAGSSDAGDKRVMGPVIPS